MSKNFDRVKRFYEAHLWNEEMVRNAVGRWITDAEFQEITGKSYAAETQQAAESAAEVQHE